MSVFSRLTALFATLRPRTIARAVKSVDDLHTQARAHRSAARQFEDDTSAVHRDIRSTLSDIQRQLDALASQQRDHASTVTQTFAGLKRDLETLTLRESQLRAVAESDLD